MRSPQRRSSRRRRRRGRRNAPSRVTVPARAALWPSLRGCRVSVSWLPDELGAPARASFQAGTEHGSRCQVRHGDYAAVMGKRVVRTERVHGTANVNAHVRCPGRALRECQDHIHEGRLHEGRRDLALVDVGNTIWGGQKLQNVPVPRAIPSRFAISTQEMASVRDSIDGVRQPSLRSTAFASNRVRNGLCPSASQRTMSPVASSRTVRPSVPHSQCRGATGTRKVRSPNSSSSSNDECTVVPTSIHCAAVCSLSPDPHKVRQSRCG